MRNPFRREGEAVQHVGPPVGLYWAGNGWRDYEDDLREAERVRRLEERLAREQAERGVPGLDDFTPGGPQHKPANLL